MRILDLIKTANHNLFISKTRTFLTILAIFIGSFTIILSNAINAGVNDFIDKQVASIGGDGFIEVMPAAASEQVMAMMNSGSKVTEYNEKSGSMMNSYISDEDFEKLSKVDGVKTLELYKMTSPEWMRLVGGEKKYNVSVEYFPATSMNVDLLAGRMTDDAAEENEILLNEDWLEPFGFADAEEALGKEVEIGIKQTMKCYMKKDCIATARAKVVGVQAPGVLAMDGDLHINKALNDELYELEYAGVPEEQQVSAFAVGDVEPEKLDAIREAFREIGIGYEIITVGDTVGLIRTFFDVILVVFNIFGGIALIAAAIGIINTLFMSVQERTREIGLEKALGMGSGKIFAAFSLEAMLLGFWGSVVGIVVSMMVGHAANNLAHETFLESFPTFELVVFEPMNMVAITLIIMLIAFIAGTLPARRASKQNPIDALRYE